MIELYIGLMSGTSGDGVDASLIRSDGLEYLEILDNIHIPYDRHFKKTLSNIGGLSLERQYITEQKLTDYHAQAVHKLLSNNNIGKIKAIGFHGHTILHKPEKKITVQIGNPHQLAQATKIDVVHDFRRADIALGGQGAPLVPIYHKLITKEFYKPVVVVNIGGVANITYVDHSKNELIAFDCGPGNALIDDAMLAYYNKPYDKNGDIAAKGSADEEILRILLDHEFYKLPYPKSLDRNYFNDILKNLSFSSSQELITTLTRFTVKAILLGLNLLPGEAYNLFVCGGGAKNSYMMSLLKKSLEFYYPALSMQDISAAGNLDPDFIEAQAFAYLAARFFKKLPSSFTATTGTLTGTICGCLVNSQ